MSKPDLTSLEKTIDKAFDERDAISTETRGEIREAVETSLLLLDSGRSACCREAVGWRLEDQSMAEKGSSPFLPAQSDGHYRGRARRRSLVGQGAIEVRRLGRD